MPGIPPQEVEAVALELLARSLLGTAARWPAQEPEGLEGALMALGQAHGALPLLHEGSGATPDWPPALREALAARARGEAVAEAIATAEVREALAALAAARIPTLVFKGTALAHSLYARPSLRPRDDTDLLVAPEDASRAIAVLVGTGYARARAVSGAHISHQACLSRHAARGVRVNLDLHWRTSNRPRYARALHASELLARAVESPALGHAARIPCAADAMLLACTHLHGHHRSRPRLVWLADLALLDDALGPRGRAEVAARAAALDLECAVGESLALASRALGHAPGKPLDVLAGAFTPDRARIERQLDVWREDLGALPDWRSRLSLLAEHALPNATYMLERYGTRRRSLLPALYLHRALSGAVRLFRPAP